MTTENKRSFLDELRSELRWRAAEFRLIDDAYRLLEIQKEIRLLKIEIQKYKI